jgi:hypothetical protein
LRPALSGTVDHNYCNLQTRGMEPSPGKSRFVHHDVRVASKSRPSSAKSRWISRGLCAWTPLVWTRGAQLHTKHARMPSHRLRRTTPNLPTNRRQLYPALAATIGGEVFLGQTRQTPTDPRNLLMLARASCTRCRDCGREDSATSLDADALRRWQAKSMPGHVIAHILDSW